MNRIFSAAAVCLGLASAGSLAAVGGTATDRAVGQTCSPIHRGSQPEIHLLGW